MVSRRHALQSLTAAVGLAAVLPLRQVLAADAVGANAPHLEVKDPAAVKVGYTESAAKVDAQKIPSFTPGSSCENCLQLQGAAGASYRPCTLFPGKLVAAAGWCSAWTAEM